MASEQGARPERTIISSKFYSRDSTGPPKPLDKKRSWVKALPPSFLLLLSTVACEAKIATSAPSSSSDVTEKPAVTVPLPADTAASDAPTESPSGETTPTVEIDENLPSPFANLFFGSRLENGQKTIVSSVFGTDFENKNPGCVVPYVNGAHESQLNVLYNPNAPDMAAGFMVDNNYLMSYFNAADNKSGRTQGYFKGTSVELVDNVWQMQQDGQTLFFNPVIPNQAGHFFGYPVVCEQNGQLMTTLTVDEHGEIVDGASIKPAFISATDIAKEYGYTSTGKPASIGLKSDGQMEVKDANGNPLAYLPFLGKAEAKIFPTLPEGVSDLTVYNYETGKDEVLLPVFDENVNTWVWKNGDREIRRFLDLKTGHIFSQTASVGQHNQPRNQRIIYQVDTDFGWEADLSNIDKTPKDYTPTGLQYLVEIQENFSGIINVAGSRTTITFKIVHGSYDDIADKSKVSYSLNNGTIMAENFFWPVYDPKNNTYILKEYLASDYVLTKDPVRAYIQGLLNWCPTANPPERPVILPVVTNVPKKSIQ